MTSEEFKEARAELGLTQGQLAEELGVALNTVSRYELAELPIVRMTELAMNYLLLLHRGKQKTKKKEGK